jgi:hypothetical protein
MNLSTAKAFLKNHFKGDSRISGFGLGEDHVKIYTTTKESLAIPSELSALKVEFVFTGVISEKSSDDLTSIQNQMASFVDILEGKGHSIRACLYEVTASSVIQRTEYLGTKYGGPAGREFPLNASDTGLCVQIGQAFIEVNKSVSMVGYPVGPCPGMILSIPLRSSEKPEMVNALIYLDSSAPLLEEMYLVREFANKVKTMSISSFDDGFTPANESIEKGMKTVNSARECFELL